MARPLFLICSESGVVDRFTNSSSVFNIIESIQFLRTKDGGDARPAGEQDATPHLRIRILASWLADEADMEDSFHHETRIRMPGSNTWQTVATGTFVWKTKHHRFITNLRGLDPDEGVLLVEDRVAPIRPNAEWVAQQYEITVEAS